MALTVDELIKWTGAVSQSLDAYRACIMEGREYSRYDAWWNYLNEGKKKRNNYAKL